MFLSCLDNETSKICSFAPLQVTCIAEGAWILLYFCSLLLPMTSCGSGWRWTQWWTSSRCLQCLCLCTWTGVGSVRMPTSLTDELTYDTSFSPAACGATQWIYCILEQSLNASDNLSTSLWLQKGNFLVFCVDVDSGLTYDFSHIILIILSWNELLYVLCFGRCMTCMRSSNELHYYFKDSASKCIKLKS